MYNKYFETYKGYEIQIGHESQPFNTIAKVFNSQNERFPELESWGTSWKSAVRKAKNKIDQL